MGSVSSVNPPMAGLLKSTRSASRWTLALRWCALLLLPALVSATDPREADKDTSAIAQASYIYNVAKLVEWKDAGMKSGNFKIGVIGSTNLYQELIKKYASRSIGKQPIEVLKLPRSADVEPCHILFVGQSDLGLMPALYKNLKGRPTLLVTEYEGALEDGSVVNFVRIDNTLKYELSLKNAAQHKLEVGTTLVNLAHSVAK
jgi:hypothetical protein